MNGAEPLLVILWSNGLIGEAIVRGSCAEPVQKVSVLLLSDLILHDVKVIEALGK
ncbi:MAG: hypothetical protein AAGC74_02575 [Verrucomicrobiota bacterium]